MDGKQIKAERTGRGITLEKLAELTGLSPSFLSRLENGQRGKGKKRDGIKLEHQIAVAQALGLPLPIGEEKTPDKTADRETALAPLLSWVSAGRLNESVSTPSSDKSYSVDDLGPGDYFALQVRGSSMNRVSPDGSVIIVNRRQISLQRGKPFVFGIRGEVTYKLWEDNPPSLWPDSTDPANKPIFLDKKSKLFVIGRVRRTILDL